VTDDIDRTLGLEPASGPAHGAQPVPPDSTETNVENRTSLVRWVAELVLMVGLAFLLATGIRTFIIQPYVIPSGSMIPTIELWDRVVALKFTYRFGEPQVGDIVVLDDPTGQVDTLIKRVIATEGQTVDLVDGAVVVDGVTLVEPYTHGKPSNPQIVSMPYVVPEDSVWVMGDNRTDSQDSRYFGAVPVSEVRGKAVFRFWPIDRIGPLDSGS